MPYACAAALLPPAVPLLSQRRLMCDMHMAPHMPHVLQQYSISALLMSVLKQCSISSISEHGVEYASSVEEMQLLAQVKRT
jgi:hypothetical protein